MGLLDRETRQQLSEALDEITLLHQPGGLDLLLVGLPERLVRQASRTGTPAVDVPRLVELCDGWDMANADEPHPLCLLIESARKLKEGSTTAAKLQSLLDRLGCRGTRRMTAATLHQLRPPVADFVGRVDEITQVVAAVRAAQGRGTGAIYGIRGMGGTGKTELAYAVALMQVRVDFLRAPAHPDLEQAEVRLAEVRARLAGEGAG